MAKITDLVLMKQYVLRKMGSPVVQIEISDDQLEQAISDSVQLFQKYHTGEGNYQDYLSFTVTKGVSAYSTEGLNIEATLDFNFVNTCDGINVLFSPQNHLLFRDWVLFGNYPGGSGGGYGGSGSGMVLTGYEIALQYLNDINDMFSVKFRAQYSTARQEFLLTPTPEADGVGLLTVYRRETAENLYNNELVKELAVAEATMQWGRNLRKYNMQLPEGGSINWSEIFSEGKEDKARIVEQIQGESEPPCFFIE